MNSKHKHTLICIDDYPEILEILRIGLEKQGYSVLTANGGREGRGILAKNGISGAVVDFDMPEMNGGEVADAIRVSHPHIPILMLSGTLVGEDILKRVDGFLLKGRPISELVHDVGEFFSQFGVGGTAP